MNSFTHFNRDGEVHMVDVSGKPITLRKAEASARVTMQPETLAAIMNLQVAKGDVRQVARLAGIMGAKQTSQLIPLCHALPLSQVEVDIEPESKTTVAITSRVVVQASTGAEMEALTAASIAALTLYDMCKSMDRAMRIGPIQLESKSGGKSGDFCRSELSTDATTGGAERPA